MGALENYSKKSVIDEAMNKMEIAVHGFNPYYWKSRSAQSLSDIHPYELWWKESENLWNRRFSEMMTHTSP